MADSFYSYYGQLRGGTINSSIVFNNPGEIHSSEAGRVTIIINDHTNDFGWFESSLGNTVIITHEDKLSTVYANLDDETIPDEIQTNTTVLKGSPLGSSGNSAWQESGQSALEFKVFDNENDTSVNPRVLMPRVGAELPLEIGTVTLRKGNFAAISNKEGEVYDMRLTRRVPSGEYFIYKRRQPVAAPFKTSVSINGATVETISYDVLEENGSRLCVKGNNYYSWEELYPDDQRQLVGTAILSRGSNMLTITLTNMLNVQRTVSYRLDVY